MIIMTWNIWGLNQLHKQSYIRKFAKEYSIDVLGILKTKVKAMNQDKIQKTYLDRNFGIIIIVQKMKGKFGLLGTP